MHSLEERNNNGECGNEVREGARHAEGARLALAGAGQGSLLSTKLESFKPLNRLTLIGDDLSLP